MDFDFNKSEFRDAVKLRYDWEVPDTPSVCVIIIIIIIIIVEEVSIWQGESSTIRREKTRSRTKGR